MSRSSRNTLVGRLSIKSLDVGGGGLSENKEANSSWFQFPEVTRNLSRPSHKITKKVHVDDGLALQTAAADLELPHQPMVRSHARQNKNSCCVKSVKYFPFIQEVF